MQRAADRKTSVQGGMDMWEYTMYSRDGKSFDEMGADGVNLRYGN